MLRTARWRVLMALSLMVPVLTVLPGTAAIAAPEDIVISEVMFNPVSAEDDWEWIEIYNTGASDVDLTGWVVDDINSTAHASANIAAGTVPAGGSAILFNSEDVAVADFEAAWGTGMNLVEVTSWGAMALNNGGDTIGLWTDFASYTGDQATHASAVLSVAYDGTIDDNNASTYLSDLADDTSWTLSTDGGATPVGTGYASANAGGNDGGEIGSPGGTLGSGEPPLNDHLLLTEVVITPTAAEFVEIHNPTDAPIDLSDVYITDAFFSGGDEYWNIVTLNPDISGGGGFSDWHARFPDGASIAAGEYQTLAIAGSDDFFAEYLVDPTYELFEDGDAADAIPDMRDALPGTIVGDGSNTPGLSNSGESVVLYHWDGVSDLVQDLDYVVWGDGDDRHDKTGISLDGPDADSDASTYLPETPAMAQEVVPDHSSGVSSQRRDLTEGTETKTGGNGVTGDDETSENLTVTWGEAEPTPNAATTLPPPDTGGEPAEPADHLLLTEVVITPTEGEYVEIYNPTDATIDLSNVYLTDGYFGGGDFYWNIVTGDVNIIGGGGFGDWHARFPDGATIAPEEYQTVAIAGSDDFFATYLVDPTYELFEDGDAPDAIPDMRDSLPGSIIAEGSTPGLSNSGESVVLFQWDGLSDLVQDLDYVVWGDGDERHDKTGVTIDGPDADSDESAYLDDTATGFQEFIASHASGVSSQRRDLSEGTETKEGGNGLTGNDETSENLTVTWGETAPTPNAATTLPPPDTGGGGPDPLPEPGVCGDPFTAIYTIQGTGAASPFDGTPVITEGVVTSLMDGLGGFAIQDPVGDLVDASSDGIFVFADGTGLSVGQAVRVVGHVDEFFDLTEITSLTDEDVIVLPCEGGAPVAPTHVDLPVDTDFEPYEGMLVTFDDVEVTDMWDLVQFGQFQVSGPDRMYIPTDLVDPGPAVDTVLDFNNRSRFIIDDGSSASNPSPVPFIEDPVGTFNTFRLGDRVVEPTGIMYFGFGDYQLIPTTEVVFDADGRPEVPDVGGFAKVVSLNVLNYFTTLNQRGANSDAEFDRQEAKLVAAIQAMDADIIGLQEIENNGPTAIGALVDALNLVAAPGETWAAVPDPVYDLLPGGLEETNAIKVGIIYRSDRVATNGDPSFSSPDDDFINDRPPVGQTFVADGETFTVIVNHFKSKGCSGTDPGDEFEDEADIGDGQACYAPRRTRMAEATLDLVADVQASTGDPDVLVIGDFNSYAQEDPIDVLRAGLVDLTASQPIEERRSFVFRGETGQLDYAFATPEMATKVTGAAHWHINADEVRSLDYNQEFNPEGLYNVDPFRSSDHDPVIVGIGEAQLAPRAEMMAVSAELRDLVPTGRFWDDWRIAVAVWKLDRATDAAFWVGDTHVTSPWVYGLTIGSIWKLGKVRTVDTDPYADRLVAALAEVTHQAVDEAINAEGLPWKLRAAQRYLDVGDALWRDGDGIKALYSYKRAWARAAQAVSQPRFSTFNASLNRGAAGELVVDLLAPTNEQAQTIAEIIQVNRPNVVLINEFDYDSGGVAADLFRSNYLEVGQNGQAPIHYPYMYVAPSNTGIDSGFDLDNNGSASGSGNDAFGFGFYEGQYGMLVLSQHPIDHDALRTFQNFLWKDMPGAILPDDPATAAPADWYSPEELDVFRLSSKSHWDVPILIGRKTVHFLTSHPTPPVFDGDEDRNGTRNFDEIRFWADYVDPAASGYIYDDAGVFGGLYDGARFVIAGDQNSDPFDGDSIPGAIQQLLDSPYVNTSITPSSEGAVEQAGLQGGANDSHLSDPAFDTADFADGSPGNLRADYVLPSMNLRMLDAAVFWPLEADPLFPLVGTWPFPSSDHRLVWVDLKV